MKAISHRINLDLDRIFPCPYPNLKCILQIAKQVLFRHFFEKKTGVLSKLDKSPVFFQSSKASIFIQ